MRIIDYSRKDLEKNIGITYPCVMDMKWHPGKGSNFPKVTKLYFMTLFTWFVLLCILELVQDKTVFATIMNCVVLYFIWVLFLQQINELYAFFSPPIIPTITKDIFCDAHIFSPRKRNILQLAFVLCSDMLLKYNSTCISTI